MGTQDVFISYAQGDGQRVRAIREALVARGLAVWLDEAEIGDLEPIPRSITQGLKHSKVLLAFYSALYPTRRACQWELTAAFLAAQRDRDPRRRVLVVNPEESAAHIEPVELRDALFRFAPTLSDDVATAELANAVVDHVAGVSGELGEFATLLPPAWHGHQPSVETARFVGRAADLWKVHSALQGGAIGVIGGAGGVGLAQVTGLGGIGKSLLAEEYALRFGAAYPGGVFWLRAYGHDDSKAALSAAGLVAERDEQLRALAVDLGLGVEDLLPEEVPAALAGTLEMRADPYLWIVDDLPTGLGREELGRWLALGRWGKTLFTTRSREYGGLGGQVELGALGEQEGVELLSAQRRPIGPDDVAARKLVADLGGHALALDIAGAALRTQRGVCSFAEYRDALADSAEDELEFAAELSAELPQGHARSIASTLARSVKRLGEEGSDFLRLACVLAVEPIPTRLVVNAFADADGLEQEIARRRAASAMRQVEALSLADIVGDEHNSRRVHPLVSRTVRFTDLATERQATLRQAAIAALTAELEAPAGSEFAAGGGGIVHARHLATPPHEEGEARLLAAVARHNYDRGDYRSSRAQYEQVLTARRRVSGEEHPDTLGSMVDLAKTLRAQGDLSGARALQEQALEAFRRVLGDEHPDTLRSMDHLAETLGDRGDLSGARALQEQALEAFRRVLGDEQPATLNSMNNLAATLWAQGDMVRASVLFEQVLHARVRVLGAEHPDTLRSMNNLASTRRAHGDLTGARTLGEQVLSAFQRLLGDEHPATLSAMSSLAETLRAQGDLAHARALQEQALEAFQRLLGDENPATLSAMSNLAETLRAQGELPHARALQEHALAAFRRLLGDEHPATLAAMNNLAETLQGQGDVPGATTLQEQSLKATGSAPWLR